MGALVRLYVVLCVDVLVCWCVELVCAFFDLRVCLCVCVDVLLYCCVGGLVR